jgi:hypothetical protein
MLTIASILLARVIDTAPTNNYKHALYNYINKSIRENGQYGNNGITGGGCDPNTLYIYLVGDRQPLIY